MRRQVRSRFWVEAALAALASALGVLTLIAPDWIEALTGVDPDAHSGSLEWALAGALAATALVVLAVARAEWRRPAFH
jgi:hypothetical protein